MTENEGIIAVVLVLIIIGIGTRIFNKPRSPQYSPQYICTNCGWQGGVPRVEYRGNVIIAIILLIFFVIPGILYILWSYSTKYNACQKCGKDTLISIHTPMGQSLLKTLDQSKQKNYKQ